VPNRFIKESICTSENLDRLTAEEEVFCYRLIVNCDDFGRFHADPILLRSRLFPRRTEKIKPQDIVKWLFALSETAKMIGLYKNGDKIYLQFIKWSEHQQKRANTSKFPAPDDTESQLISIDINGNHSITNVSVFVFDNDKRIRNRKTNNESEYSCEFEEFWKEYPRQEAKATTYKQWNLRIKSGELVIDMINGAKCYAVDCKGRERKFIKLPSTFIGPDKHYKDYVRGVPNGTNQQQPGQTQNKTKYQDDEYAGFFGRNDPTDS
jgi:hypothetical protein